MLGFNFYPPSPRYLDPAACARPGRPAARRQAAPVPALVGVFVNATPGDVRRDPGRCGLDLAQLQRRRAAGGSCARSAGGRSRPSARGRAERRRLWPRRIAVGAASRPALLLDASRAGPLRRQRRSRATGAVAAALARAMPISCSPAGSTPTTSAAAVAAVQPWGVDVASGVESAPGVKDARSEDSCGRCVTRQAEELSLRAGGTIVRGIDVDCHRSLAPMAASSCPRRSCPRWPSWKTATCGCRPMPAFRRGARTGCSRPTWAGPRR